MEEQLRPSIASEIVLPPRERLVELDDLRTSDGKPAQVLCERLDQLYVHEHFGLPGDRPLPEGGEEGHRRIERVRRILSCAPALVHRGTALMGKDGALVRPAFHCTESAASAGSIPWEALSLSSQLRVVNALLDLSGYGGAAEASFPGRD